MSLRSPLGKVLGLGAAKEGAGHWWSQRVTAVALVALGIWFVASLFALQGFDYDAVTSWIRHPVNATLLALFVAVSAYHSQLGLQVVIEDYVHNEKLKLASIMANNFFSFAVALASIYAILKLSSGV